MSETPNYSWYFNSKYLPLHQKNPSLHLKNYSYDQANNHQGPLAMAADRRPDTRHPHPFMEWNRYQFPLFPSAIPLKIFSTCICLRPSLRDV